MSTPSANIDAFDEDEAPIEIKVSTIDLNTVPKENLDVLLKHKRRESQMRAMKKIMLAVISQIPFIITLIRGMQ